MKVPVAGLFAGSVQPMPGDGRPTAIFKQPVGGRLAVGFAGLAGDAQADRRVHGGPEKALHHFPMENYALLSRAFPHAAAGFIAGGIGENISTTGIDESTACIGDVFALGTARVQLCQPRTPCWKIDARHQAEGITRHVADAGIAGWYYRVLATGDLSVGDDLELIERAADPISLTEFWTVVRAHRPAHDAVRRLLDTPGLSDVWQKKLRQRLDWLQAN